MSRYRHFGNKAPENPLQRGNKHTLVSLKEALGEVSKLRNKSEMERFKRARRLKASVTGVSTVEARTALHTELSAMIKELERSVANHSSPTVGVNSVAGDANAQKSQFVAGAAISLFLGFAGWCYLDGSTHVVGTAAAAPVAQEAPNTPAAQIRTNEAATSAAPSESPDHRPATAVPRTTNAATVEMQANEAKPNSKDTREKNSDHAEQQFSTGAQIAGAAILFGSMWLIWQSCSPTVGPPRQQDFPESPPDNEKPGHTTSDGCSGDNLKSEGFPKFADQVFENMPDKGQPWDMSASIRGVPGGVKRKVEIYDKK